MSTKRAPQTPGEEPQDTVEQGGEATNPSTADLMAIIERQAAQVAALTSAVQNLARNQPSTVAAEELPDASTIDRATLKTPVLTKQGWFVPEIYGSNQNAAARL
jgi:hypothetical protein